MIHLVSMEKVLNITSDDIELIKKEANSFGFKIVEKTSKYQVYNGDTYMGEFTPNGKIIGDTTGTVYDLLSSVANNK